ncbi:Uncharacterised protein [uncultured archaeon]|nr:Uncharacterised protein [uncultured archaeon]
MAAVIRNNAGALPKSTLARSEAPCPALMDVALRVAVPAPVFEAGLAAAGGLFAHYSLKSETYFECSLKAKAHESNKRKAYVSRRPPAFFVRVGQAEAHLEMAKELANPESGVPFKLNIGIKEELSQYHMGMRGIYAELAKAKGRKKDSFKKPKAPEGYFILLGKSVAYKRMADDAVPKLDVMLRK